MRILQSPMGRSGKFIITQQKSPNSLPPPTHTHPHPHPHPHPPRRLVSTVPSSAQGRVRRWKNEQVTFVEKVIKFVFLQTGLVADTMGSYTPAFYMAGGAVLAGACIPFFLLCRKERSASRDLWTTLGPTAESADVPDWRKSVVYTVDKKASIRDPN